jgi:hypothetical protein
MHRKQLVRRHPLLPAHKLSADAGQGLVPVGRITGHVSASTLMECYHTARQFGVGPLEQARTLKFLPRSCSPWFSELEVAASRGGAVDPHPAE